MLNDHVEVPESHTIQLLGRLLMCDVYNNRVAEADNQFGQSSTLIVGSRTYIPDL